MIKFRADVSIDVQVAQNPLLMLHKKIVSLLFLLLGISLLYIGVKEVYLLTAYLDSLIPITPATESKLMIIFGAAASISGFVGIIRDRVIEV